MLPYAISGYTSCGEIIFCSPLKKLTAVPGVASPGEVVSLVSLLSPATIMMMINVPIEW